MRQVSFAFVVLLVCCTFMWSSVAAPAKSNPDLKDLCEAKEGVKIGRLSHIQALASQLEDPNKSAACSENVLEFVKQLNQLVSDRLACSMKKSNKIAELYKEYIAEDPNNERQVKLKPLVDFFIAYGLKVSAICRRHMMDTFLRHAKHTLFYRDVDELDEFAGLDSPIGRLLTPLTEPGEILLPSDVMGFFPEANHEQLYVKDTSAEQLREAKSFCELQLEPLYEESVKPLAVLARVGFSYRTILEKSELWLLPGAHLEMRHWTNMVFFCESLKTVQIDKHQVGNSNCRINLETIENGQPVSKSVMRPAKKQIKWLWEEIASIKHHKRVDKFVPTAEIGDKVIGKYDFQLKKAVRSFDLKKGSSAQKMTKLFLDRSLEILLAKFKTGEYEEAFKTFLSRINGNKEDPDLELVKQRLVDVVKTRKIGAIYALYQIPYFAAKVVQVVLFWIGAAPLVAGTCALGENGASARGKIMNEFSTFRKWYHEKSEPTDDSR